MREVGAVAAMLARIIGLRAKGRVEEARVELEEAFGLLLGPQTELVRRLDPRTAAVILVSPERILAFARLVAEEAAQSGDDTRRAGLLLRAAELGIEAARGPGEE